MAAQYIILTLPLGFFFLSKSKNQQGWFLFAISISLMLTYIFYTKTKASWIAIFLQIVFLLFMFNNEIKNNFF